MFRIVRGSVRDFGRRFHVYRHGWWWHSYIMPKDELQPYSPEGPFYTKAEAIRHLTQTKRSIYNRNAVVADNIKWVRGDGYSRKQGLRPVPGTILFGKKLNAYRKDENF